MSPDQNISANCETLWDTILTADRYFLEKQPIEELPRIRGIWFQDLMNMRYQLQSYGAGRVLFFRSLVRVDYKSQFHKVIAASGIYDPVIFEDYKRPLPIGQIDIAASRSLLSREHLTKSYYAAHPEHRALLWLRVAGYSRVRDHFARLPTPRAVVFFADMQPIEHLLALHFRARGVPTVTLQHGLYVDYGDYDTINRINYLHQPADYFLSWGPHSSALIKHHQPCTKVVECGKPVIFKADPPEGVAPAPRPYIALLLDQKPFHAQNEAMIEIVQAYALRSNMDLVARFHPSLPKAQILKKYPALKEQQHFSDADLVVGHTTSMIYEALALGLRVMRYASDIPAIALPETAEFSSLTELEAGLALPQPTDLWKRYFTAIGDPALKNYRAFFDDLLALPQKD